jgi:NAD(P)-dependent dehydrogenase (short-subunit alcohol dehydrogenase family)
MSSSSWVLITGGNRGLGYVTVKKLVDDGESVIIGARTQASGALQSEITSDCILLGRLYAFH